MTAASSIWANDLEFLEAVRLRSGRIAAALERATVVTRSERSRENIARFGVSILLAAALVVVFDDTFFLERLREDPQIRSILRDAAHDAYAHTLDRVEVLFRADQPELCDGESIEVVG